MDVNERLATSYPPDEIEQACRIGPECPTGCVILERNGKVDYWNNHTGLSITTNFTKEQIRIATEVGIGHPAFLNFDDAATKFLGNGAFIYTPKRQH